MTSSQIILFAILCMPISLFSYFFFLLPRISRWVRTYTAQCIDIRLISVFFVFYLGVFLVIGKAFLFFEGILFPNAWQQILFVFVCVTGLLMFSFYCATGGLVIKAPVFCIERIVFYVGDTSTLSQEVVKMIMAQQGEVLLELSEKNMIIAQMVLPEKVVIEYTWQPLFWGNTLVQMVCYPASRSGYVEKKRLNAILNAMQFFTDFYKNK